jgi:hypothetical protein
VYNGFAVITSADPLGDDQTLGRISVTSDGWVQINDNAACQMVFLGHISFPGA